MKSAMRACVRACNPGIFFFIDNDLEVNSMCIIDTTVKVNMDVNRHVSHNRIDTSFNDDIVSTKGTDNLERIDRDTHTDSCIARTGDRCSTESVTPDNVKQLISEDSLWTKFNITKSPGDGHCFLHSVVTSLNAQLPKLRPLDKATLTCKLDDETLFNAKQYCGVMGSGKTLLKELNDYVVNRVYDTLFGDIVPNIVANALGIGFVIVYVSQHGKLCVNVVTSRNENNTYWVVLYKSGTHYDAVIPASSFF